MEVMEDPEWSGMSSVGVLLSGGVGGGGVITVFSSLTTRIFTGLLFI